MGKYVIILSLLFIAIISNGETIKVTTVEGVELALTRSRYSEAGWIVGYDRQEDKAAIDTWTSGKVTIPDELEGLPIIRVGEEAFQGCNRLTEVYIPQTVTLIERKAFEGCGFTSIDVPASVMSIGEYAFRYCSKLNQVILHENLQEIENKAFAGCSSLFSISIPSSVTSVHCNAFDGSGLQVNVKSGLYLVDGWVCGRYDSEGDTEVAFPEGTRGIGTDAFNSDVNGTTNVDKITKIVLPSTLMYAASDEFKGCTSLQSLSTGGLKDLSALFNTSKSQTQRFPNLESLIIGDGVTTIEQDQFHNCLKLRTLILGAGLKKIDISAFSGCEKLEKVHIPNGVEHIGGYAFSGCESMTTLTIPSSVKYIGSGAFSGCMGLVSINSLINIPFVIDEDVFQCHNYGYDKRTIYYIATLYVPRGRAPIYSNVSSWKLFSNIVEKDFAYNLVYVLDGEVYKSMEIQEGVTVTPEAAPVKDGFIFSGWQTVPNTMPAHDVIVYGYFEPISSGIEEITTDIKRRIDTWFTLDGQMLPSKPSKPGLYIHNGWKVVVK